MIEETLVAPEWLAARLEDEDLAVVDCRFSLADPNAGQVAYAAAHIPGAVYAHLDRDLSDPVIAGRTGRHPLPDPEETARRFGRMGIGDGVQVVAYDGSDGSIAARLWWQLHFLGHRAAAVLDGGWAAWVDARLPVAESGPEVRVPRTFVPRPQPELLADADAVLEMLDALHPAGPHTLLDARAAERYEGRNETLDPVAGHIAGAVSAPFADNVGPDGRMRPPAELRERYLALLDGADPAEAVAYCGSGVTAAHIVLAMRHAGMPAPRLYAGSWSEWITDPGRPIARGAREGNGSSSPTTGGASA